MSTIETSVELEVPVRVAYDQWARFEEFPKFMDGIESVTPLYDRSLRWRAHIGGGRVEWTAEITEQECDHRISWRAIDGTPHTGTIRFEALGDRRSQASLKIAYTPQGFLQTLGAAFGLVSRRVERALANFKTFIEFCEHEPAAIGPRSTATKRAPPPRMSSEPSLWRGPVTATSAIDAPGELGA